MFSNFSAIRDFQFHIAEKLLQPCWLIEYKSNFLVSNVLDCAHPETTKFEDTQADSLRRF